MKFFELLQRNRLFVHYLTLIIIITGIMALRGMQREARPNVNFNRVAVAVAYPGASPGDIEELVVDPIEEKIDEVDGVEEYRSISYPGAGAISIQIDDQYPDPEEVVDEIRRKISEVRDLPEEVDDPLVQEIKAINIPVLRIALFGELSAFDLKLEVEKFKDYLNSFPGVQSVTYTGLEDLQLKVLANPKKLNLYDLTLIELINSLGLWAKQRPGGLLENETSTSNLLVGTDYNNVEDIKNFVVRSNDNYQSIKIKDVAQVEYGLENTQIVSLYEDHRAALLTVTKKPFADAVDTVDEIKAGLKKYKLPEELKFQLYRDESKRVRDRLGVVSYNALFGLLLVLVLLILFLDWRSAVVTSIGIPVALLGGIIVISLLGNTMNSLVLVGMIIVLGMLVDDAIVVCENIYAYIEQGENPVQAALKGVRQIAIPVVATVLTTIFAFAPILFMQEIIGQFLRIIPLTVISMLVVSLFEAMVILPVHASEIMTPTKKKKITFFSWLEPKYERYLKWSMKYRWAIAAGVLVIIVLSFFQAKHLFQRFTLFPATGLQGLSVRVELPKNTPIDTTIEKVQILSRSIQEIGKDSLDSVFSTIGEVTTGGASGSRQNGSHLGMVNVVFTSDPTFIYREKEVISEIRKKVAVASKQENIKTSITLDRPGPPIGRPIQLQVTSRDLEFGKKIVDQVKDELAKIDGVHSLETDLDGDSKKYRFEVNNLYAVTAGVTPSDISRTVFAASSGVVTSEILKNNEKVEILVGLPKSSNLTTQDIMKLKVTSSFGQVVPIKKFIKVKEELGPSSIQRLNGLRTITLFGEVDEKVVTGKEANVKIRPLIKQLRKDNPTVTIEIGGGEKDRMKALRDTMRLYLLAILLVFMTISLAFRSVLYPFLVLSAIPMGLCGVVWSLRLHGMPLSLMGIIGIVGLTGVVVNVSIILLSLVKEKLGQGKSLQQALTEAAMRRLRPIIITTISTLIGLAPTIYGIGGVDTFVQPLALVLGWGLAVATFLTLTTLPALLSFVTPLEKD